MDAPSACPGVFFHCPLIGPEVDHFLLLIGATYKPNLEFQVLPKSEMKERIRQFLYAQLDEEKGLTACLIIHTFAKDSEKVGQSYFFFN